MTDFKYGSIQISMTENGDPYENALAERMNRTIKEEMLNNRIFDSFEQAKQAIDKAKNTTRSDSIKALTF